MEQVEQVTQTVSPILEIVVQAALIIIPALLTWFIRNYVKGTSAEREVAAIINLANTAIDYVENLEKRGDIVIDPSLSKGAAKLALAGRWLEKEAERAGIAITDEQAREWISSQFQRRLGDVKVVGTMAGVAREALTIVEQLVDGGLVTIPADADRFLFLCQLAADWVVMQLAARGVSVTREEALTLVRAEYVQQLNERPYAPVEAEIPTSPPDLQTLVTQALSFVSSLPAPNGVAPTNGARRDLATAWVLTEVAKRGLPYAPAEIAAAVRYAIAV
jgi:hypothetical protein